MSTDLRYMCTVCPEIRNYRRIQCDSHSFRTDHKMVIQTPEALLEATKVKSRYDIVQEIENKLAAFIIDPSRPHDGDCRCARCFSKFQSEWLKNNG